MELPRIIVCNGYLKVRPTLVPKTDKVNPRAKKFVFLGDNKNMKGYKLWDPENKKIVLSKHVTFDETSLLKPIISQQVERTKTKDASQR